MNENEESYKPKKLKTIINTHKAIAFGSACVLIGNNNGLENLSELLEIEAHGVAVSLPGEPPNKDLGVGSVTKRGIQELEPRWAGTGTRPRTLIRHE